MEGQDPLTEQVIGAAIEVHRGLGPGLLESVYRECLCHELRSRGVEFQCPARLPVVYKGRVLEQYFEMDAFLSERLVVELKAVEKLLPIHDAQLLTYMRLSRTRLGPLLNFNVRVLKDGIKRLIL